MIEESNKFSCIEISRFVLFCTLCSVICKFSFKYGCKKSAWLYKEENYDGKIAYMMISITQEEIICAIIKIENYFLFIYSSLTSACDHKINEFPLLPLMWNFMMRLFAGCVQFGAYFGCGILEGLKFLVSWCL